MGTAWLSKQKQHDHENNPYQREPLAADMSRVCCAAEQIAGDDPSYQRTHQTVEDNLPKVHIILPS